MKVSQIKVGPKVMVRYANCDAWLVFNSEAVKQGYIKYFGDVEVVNHKGKNTWVPKVDMGFANSHMVAL
jgi:hypothetical protein